MKGLNLKGIFNLAGKWVADNATAILTGVIITGVGTTGILAAKGGQASLYAIEDAEMEKENLLTTKETIKVVYPYYLPAISIAAVTITCVLGLNNIHSRRSAALAGLYSLTEASFKEYKEKMLEEVGPRKVQKVEDEIAQQRLDENPISKNKVIETGKGETLCYDVLSGRYFKSDIESIKRAQNDFNFKLINDALMWMSVNELYYEMGLRPIKLGDHMGWSTEKLLEMRFASKLTDQGDPCLVIDYLVDPRFLYHN